jgi:hypothetical protein
MIMVSGSDLRNLYERQFRNLLLENVEHENIILEISKTELLHHQV